MSDVGSHVTVRRSVGRPTSQDDDEGNDGLDPEVIIAREEPAAEQFAEYLSRTLGEVYICDAHSGHW